MLFSTLVIALAAASSSLFISPVLAAEHVIQVGYQDKLQFWPTQTNASVGDTVVFSFQNKNHSVINSQFNSPCHHNGTFDSGYIPVANGSQPVNFTITVNNSNPIWFYCSQKNPADHCHLGMVGVINAPPAKTFAQFQAHAMGMLNGTSNSTSSSSSTGGYGSASGSTSPSGNSSATGSGSAAPSTSSGKNAASHGRTAAAAGWVTLLGLVVGSALC